MELYQIAIYLVVFVALALAVYISVGGRAIFGTSENPSRVVGKIIQFKEIECAPNGRLPESIKMPAATVGKYNNSKYYIKYLEPFELNGKKESFAYIQPRHKGYPISSVNKFSCITVSGIFESGESFIAEISFKR